MIKAIHFILIGLVSFNLMAQSPYLTSNIVSNQYCTDIDYINSTITIMHDNSKAILSWKMKDCYTLQVVEIQRSNDGVNYETLGFLNKGNANDFLLAGYTWVDENISNEIYYYRLKLIDIKEEEIFCDQLIISNMTDKNKNLSSSKFDKEIENKL